MSVAVDVSVHTLSASAMARFGTPEQRDELLPGMLGGEQLGAYALSEAAGRLGRLRASRRRRSATATTMWSPARRPGSATVRTPTSGCCSPAPAPTRGAGCRRSTCPPAPRDDLRRAREEDGDDRVDHDAGDLRRRPGAGGDRHRRRGRRDAIALSALDSGRLGIAACATGLAQAALDLAVGVRAGAAAVRPGDRRVPGPAVHARRHGGGGRLGAGDSTCTPRGCATPAGRSAGRPRSRSWSRPMPR